MVIAKIHHDAVMASFCSMTTGTSKITSTPKASVVIPDSIGTNSSANAATMARRLFQPLFGTPRSSGRSSGRVADRARRDQNGITSMSGSSASPMRWMKPRPQKAAMMPLMVGRNQPRQS